ncbi:hypothetical protein [Dictyobacter aurantiacus]|uniref:hypothetical protein n=1 Tax=Dictyobacter aurantiacus TaxID=1936993 RepID=UPI000F836ECF|nr:hypothetical protein [Dictyobacter aurantiacus]
MIMVSLWAILFLLVMCGQSALLVWYAWPAIRRMVHCPWCWQSCHVMKHYPPRWSSTMCPYHAHRIQAQLALKRAQRLSHACEVAR